MAMQLLSADVGFRVLLSLVQAALLVIGALLIILVLGLVLFIALPVRVRVSGSFRLPDFLGGSGDSESSALPDSLLALLPDDVAGLDDALWGASEEAALASCDGRVESSVLGGAVSVVAERGCAPVLRLLGVNVGLPAGKCGRAGKGRPGGDGKPGLAAELGKRQDAFADTGAGETGLGGISGGARGRGAARNRLAEVRKHLFSRESGPLRKELVRTLKRLIRTMHVSLDVDGVLGFGDPGITGMTYGMYQAVAGALGLTGALRLRPGFGQEVVEASGTLELWMRPAEPLWVLGRFMLSPSVRPLVRDAIRKKGARTEARAGQRVG